ncbi:MAG TPA: hypothetical protein VEO92_03570 [Candidatus Nitrosocosmicus sp.]|nr:hypothetical protein [Candidatus Nitrosocosmicus sp.]
MQIEGCLALGLIYTNQGQQRTHDSGTQISNLEKEKKKDIEQALLDKGFEPGSIDGVIDTQTQSAISNFSGTTTCQPPARWTSKRQSGWASKSCLQHDLNGNVKNRSGTESSFGAEGSTSPSSRVE